MLIFGFRLKYFDRTNEMIAPDWLSRSKGFLLPGNPCCVGHTMQPGRSNPLIENPFVGKSHSPGRCAPKRIFPHAVKRICPNPFTKLTLG